ncbi:hypothetical protein [Carbonactinospora thermoautotrophica]|uniref:hypothetical protein n=1 Tax=Carbonactinospora thermoautotrophica TaxID=1469144 RepID=UPI00114737CE|nr:hypothetical protein [Carbonactinospora thermoautotrophica]
MDEKQKFPSMECDLEVPPPFRKLEINALFTEPRPFDFPFSVSPFPGIAIGHGLTGTVADNGAGEIYRWCTRGSQKRLLLVEFRSENSAFLSDSSSAHKVSGFVRLAARLANDFAYRMGCTEPPIPEPTAAVTSFAAMTNQPRPAPLPGGKICGLATPQSLGLPTGQNWITWVAPPRSTPMEACFAETSAKNSIGDPKGILRFAIARDILADPALFITKADDQTVYIPRYQPIPGARGKSWASWQDAWLHTTCHGEPVVYHVNSWGQRGVTPAEQLRVLVTAVEERDGCERSFS